MSTFQRIAATTWAMNYLTGSAARQAVPEAVVTLNAPDQQPAASRDEPRLNIYLVQVVPNPVMRAMDLPTRTDSGGLLAGPRVALNLRYLLSFFGPSVKAHQMLGAVELALREHAVLDPALITAALADQPDIQSSGLESQSPPVQITPLGITLEELSRFWSGFFQVPYTLSTLYEASVVIIESALAPTVSLPVRTVELTTTGFAPQLDPLPVVDYASGAVVPVSGQGLSSRMSVQLAGQWTPLAALATGGLGFALPTSSTGGPGSASGAGGLGSASGAGGLGSASGAGGLGSASSAGGSGSALPSAGGLGFALPASISAGAHLVRLGDTAGTPAGVPSVLPGSNTQALVVRPVVESASFDTGNSQVSVSVSPAPGAGQSLALSLVALQPAAADSATSVRLTTPSTRQDANVSFRTPTLTAGPYLVIVEVDGVASSPVFSGDQYNQPQVQIS